MNLRSESLADLERRTDAKRRALSASVVQVSHQLQPAALAQEVTERVKGAASEALHQAVDGAQSKTKVPPAAIGVALSALGLVWGLYRSAGTVREGEADTFQRTASVKSPAGTLSETPPHLGRDVVGLAVKLLPALAAGAVVAKLVPQSRAEQDLLSGVNVEMRSAADRWVKGQTTRLVQPPAGEAFRPVNALALGLAVLLTPKKSKT